MADDYIKRNDALNASKLVYIECLYTDDDGYLEGEADDIPVVLKRDIEAIPASDVVEVVRCKDCKYYYEWPDDYRTCHRHYQIDGATQIMGAMGFCSDAIRKEDGDEAQGSV